MSTITTVILNITLSSPYFFGGMLIWINSLGTPRSMISHSSYASIFLFKNSLRWCVRTWSILPWQPLSSWLSIEHHSSFEFFVVIFCFGTIIASYPLSSTVVSRLNRNSVKTSSPINLVRLFCQKHHTLLVQTFLILYAKNILVKIVIPFQLYYFLSLKWPWWSISLFDKIISCASFFCCFRK